MPVHSLEHLLGVIAGLGWFYVLSRRHDGSYLAMIQKDVGTDFEYQSEGHAPEPAVWRAFCQAVRDEPATGIRVRT